MPPQDTNPAPDITPEFWAEETKRANAHYQARIAELEATVTMLRREIAELKGTGDGLLL